MTGMMIEIRGKVYPDAKAAAKAKKVAVSTVYDAVIRRNPDTIGLGRGARPKASRKGGKPPKPITVAGRRFASIAALARAIGREPRYVRASLKAGEIARNRIALAVMGLIAAEENAARRAVDRSE